MDSKLLAEVDTDADSRVLVGAGGAGFGVAERAWVFESVFSVEGAVVEDVSGMACEEDCPLVELSESVCCFSAFDSDTGDVANESAEMHALLILIDSLGYDSEMWIMGMFG